jgi:hypothetical protein
MRPLIVATLAALALAVPASAPAATSCGAINGGFENTIRATNIACKPARKLVRRWHNKAVTQSQGPGNKTVGSYTCRSRATDPEHVKVTCTYGTHKVTFFAGP